MIATPSAVNLPGMTSTPSTTINLGEGDDLNPKFLRWAVVGAVIGFVLWLIASPPGFPLHDFLHQRGPTQVVCLMMGGMLAVFVYLKWQLLQRQSKKTRQFDLALTPLIRSGDLSSITSQSEQSRSLVGKRILRLLDVWSSTGSAFQLERSADSDADLYELAVQQSYSLPKILLWAIPLLGFIGTVLGLGAAIGEFGVTIQLADDVDKLKNSLTDVTGGLSTAFDTTLLGLVASIVVQMLMTFRKRQEFLLLDECNEYCQTYVLAKLKLEKSGRGRG